MGVPGFRCTILPGFDTLYFSLMDWPVNDMILQKAGEMARITVRVKIR